MTTKRNTISNFCYWVAREELAHKYGDDIEIVDGNFIGDDTVALEIKWSTIGSTSPENARDFASRILQAAEEAENHPMNGAKVVWKHTEP